MKASILCPCLAVYLSVNTGDKLNNIGGFCPHGDDRTPPREAVPKAAPMPHEVAQRYGLTAQKASPPPMSVFQPTRREQFTNVIEKLRFAVTKNETTYTNAILTAVSLSNAIVRIHSGLIRVPLSALPEPLRTRYFSMENIEKARADEERRKAAAQKTLAEKREAQREASKRQHVRIVDGRETDFKFIIERQAQIQKVLPEGLVVRLIEIEEKPDPRGPIRMPVTDRQRAGGYRSSPSIIPRETIKSEVMGNELFLKNYAGQSYEGKRISFKADDAATMLVEGRVLPVMDCGVPYGYLTPP